MAWLMFPLAALVFAMTPWYSNTLLRTRQLDVRGMIRD